MKATRWASLAERNFKEVWRDPLSLALGAAMPAFLLLLFASLGKRAPVPVFKAGALAPAMAVFSFSMLIMFSAMLLAKDRSSGLFARLKSTPLSSADFAAAYALPFLPFALLQAAAAYAVGAALGFRLGLGAAASLLALLPAAASCLGLGLVLGAFLSENQISGLGSGLVTCFSIFSGAWFDLRLVGGVFEAVGEALPFAHAVDAARALSAGASLASTGADLGWAWAYAALLLGAGLLSLRRVSAAR